MTLVQVSFNLLLDLYKMFGEQNSERNFCIKSSFKPHLTKLPAFDVKRISFSKTASLLEFEKLQKLKKKERKGLQNGIRALRISIAFRPIKHAFLTLYP